MKLTTANTVIPKIDSLNRPFRTLEFYNPDISRCAIQSLLCDLKKKGYLKAHLLIENGERFNLYEKTNKWDAEQLLKTRGKRATQDDTFFDQLTAASFKGTPTQAAEYLGCNKDSIRSLIFQWREIGRDVYIHSYVLTKRGGRPSAVYHFAKGVDCVEKKAVYLDEGEEAYRPRSPKESFARGVSVAMIEGIRYINPKAEQWRHHVSA